MGETETIFHVRQTSMQHKQLKFTALSCLAVSLFAFSTQRVAQDIEIMIKAERDGMEAKLLNNLPRIWMYPG